MKIAWLFLTIYLLCNGKPVIKEDVKMLITAFRHGRRQSIIDFQHNIKNGKLTPNSIEETLIKAKELKDLYPKMFDSFSFEKHLKSYISYSKRCIASYLHRLDALFNYKEYESIPSENYEELTIKKFNAYYEPLLFSVFEECNVFTNLGNRSQDFKDIKALINSSKYPVFQRYYESDVIRDQSEYFRYVLIADYFNLVKENVVDLNEEERPLKKVIDENMIFNKLIQIVPCDPEINQLQITKIWIEMIKLIKSKIEGKSETKLAIFSGHDFTLYGLIRSLGVDITNISIDFNDEVNIEILDSNYIRFLYNHIDLKIPYCEKETMCTLREIEEILKDFTILDNETIRKKCYQIRNEDL